MTIRTFDKLLVVINHRLTVGSTPVAGLCDASSTKLAQKQRRSVVDQCLGYSIDVAVNEEDNTVHVTGSREYSTINGRVTIDSGYLFINDKMPRVIENTPVTGFKVVADIYPSIPWGDKIEGIWHIEDPRGFCVPISDVNLSRILKYCTVIDGVIAEPAVWIKETSWALMPTNCPEYAALKSVKARLKNKIARKDLTIGSTVEVVYGNSINVIRRVYLGKYHVLEHDLDRIGWQRFATFTKRSKLVWLFNDPVTNTKEFVSTASVLAVVEQVPAVISPDQIVDSINRDLSEGDFSKFVSLGTAVYISKTKINLDQVTLDFVPSGIEVEAREVCAFKPIKLMFVRYEGQLAMRSRSEMYIHYIFQQGCKLTGKTRIPESVTGTNKVEILYPQITVGEHKQLLKQIKFS